MKIKSTIPEIPNDIVRKIALANPAVCAKLACVSKDMREELRDLSSMAAKEAARDPKRAECQAYFAEAKTFLKNQFSNTKFVTRKDIPVLNELHHDFVIAPRTGESPNGIVMCVPHLVWFPVLMPVKLAVRAGFMFKERSRVKKEVKDCRQRMLARSSDFISKSPVWQEARLACGTSRDEG